MNAISRDSTRGNLGLRHLPELTGVFILKYQLQSERIQNVLGYQFAVWDIFKRTCLEAVLNSRDVREGSLFQIFSRVTLFMSNLKLRMHASCFFSGHVIYGRCLTGLGVVEHTFDIWSVILRKNETMIALPKLNFLKFLKYRQSRFPRVQPRTRLICAPIYFAEWEDVLWYFDRVFSYRIHSGNEIVLANDLVTLFNVPRSKRLWRGVY